MFGWRWKESLPIDHELNPIDLNYVSLSRTTDTFRNLLSERPILRRSYQEQFIAGLSYNYTYNEQVHPNRTNQFFFNGNLQTSGNTLYLATKLQGKEPNAEDPVKIAGAPFAQFVRTEFDVRNYYNFQYGTRLAGRVFTGIGIPYGNSERLPYIRQFFSGGPNSVRAFPVRSLGPGSFLDSTKVDVLTDQGGDIKLETNVEYRFPIYSIFKGAVFADAGNAWLMGQDTLQPGGTFAFNSFYKELGVGGGLGLRVDANFFVLRVDLAMPFRKSWRAEGDRWVFNDINFRSPSWRGENLVLNIAIGYPF
jgi:outer membrane protein assembly factor BamA